MLLTPRLDERTEAWLTRQPLEPSASSRYVCPRNGELRTLRPQAWTVASVFGSMFLLAITPFAAAAVGHPVVEGVSVDFDLQRGAAYVEAAIRSELQLNRVTMEYSVGLDSQTSPSVVAMEPVSSSAQADVETFAYSVGNATSLWLRIVAQDSAGGLSEPFVTSTGVGEAVTQEVLSGPRAGTSVWAGLLLVAIPIVAFGGGMKVWGRMHG